MTCKNCGVALADDQKFCHACGTAVEIEEQTTDTNEVVENTEPVNEQPINEQPTIGEPVYTAPTPVYTAPNNVYTQKPVNSTLYLVLSILATVLCCLPFGVVGIVYASKIDSLLALGDIEGAKKAAKTSTIWTIVSAVAMVVFCILYFILIFISAMATQFNA